MKIVHLCLACFFPDNYSYQENMLPKFHKMAGYDVEVIASLETFDEKGKTAYYKQAQQYLNENNVLVTRIDYKNPKKIYIPFRRFKNLEKELMRAKPDILFIHGCQFLDISVVCRYLKRNPGITVYVDNHADFSNSATNWFSKNIVHRFIWKYCAKRINPYTKKFYGVLPARVDFLKNVYGLPATKCELLVMGADDDRVEKASGANVRDKIRERYRIEEDDFLIMTGGKIDQWKTQILLLMEAVAEIKNNKVKLIVFGSVVPELRNRLNELADGHKVQYIGWVEAVDSYDYFTSADLVVFPGRHSVFWEQVAAQGIPMICKKWDGTQHVDLGGNVVFLEEDSKECLRKAIADLVDYPEKYEKMLEVARKEGKTTFSYREIARRAIE